MKVMRAFLSLMLIWLIVSCSKVSSQDEDILGVWIINHDSNELNYSLIEYQPNGDKCEFSVSLVNSLDITLYWNKWHIENNEVHTSMHNTTSFMEYGYKVVDKIVVLTESELSVDMIVPSGGYMTEVHHRVAGATKGQICDVVRRQFRNQSNQITEAS